jgi:hypothetical protein
MGLMLHRGGVEIDYAALRDVETPPATPTHVPIPHFRVVDLVKTTLGMYGHEVTAEHHAIAEEGMNYFGLLSLRSTYTGYEDTLICRNSNIKQFPVSVGCGNRTFICDNLAFYAEHSIRRRHSVNLKRDLPGLIGELIEPLTLQREAQHRTIRRYERTDISDETADHIILKLHRDGVINTQRIPEVMKEWDEPTFEEFGERKNIWRLFNGVTFCLNGMVAAKPALTRQLYQTIDGVCNVVQ